ncbi:MAG: hypothetical protein GY858_04895 [Candidatus Omnitrophica bacterium]|nr:hypothetical protein [Candidatus Omnitrophota bacterium]
MKRKNIVLIFIGVLIVNFSGFVSAWGGKDQYDPGPTVNQHNSGQTFSFSATAPKQKTPKEKIAPIPTDETSARFLQKQAQGAQETIAVTTGTISQPIPNSATIEKTEPVSTFNDGITEFPCKKLLKESRNKMLSMSSDINLDYFTLEDYERYEQAVANEHEKANACMKKYYLRFQNEADKHLLSIERRDQQILDNNYETEKRLNEPYLNDLGDCTWDSKDPECGEKISIYVIKSAIIKHKIIYNAERSGQ